MMRWRAHGGRGSCSQDFGIASKVLECSQGFGVKCENLSDLLEKLKKLEL